MEDFIMADTTYQPKTYRKTGGDEIVVASGGLITVESGGIVEVNTGGDITANGVSLIDEIAALSGLDSGELGVLNGVTAGTATASKAVILDASKDHAGISNLTLGTIGATGVVGKLILSDGANPGYKATVQTDAQSAGLTVHVPDPGAMVDAYVVLSTAALSAAEVDVLDAVSAGVASASKAAVLGASKNLDILGLPVGGLKIGAAGAEVAVTATAANLNSVPTSTATGAEIDQAALPAAMATEGLGRMGVARFVFDMAVAGDRTVAPHGTGVTIPADAVVIGGFFDVNTLFTSDNANNGTIAIMVEGANDIQTAAAVSGAPYSSIGLKAIVPKSNTPESTGIKCTVAREITCTVGTSAMLTGKLTGFLHYVVSAASA